MLSGWLSAAGMLLVLRELPFYFVRSWLRRHVRFATTMSGRTTLHLFAATLSLVAGTLPGAVIGVATLANAAFGRHVRREMRLFNKMQQLARCPPRWAHHRHQKKRRQRQTKIISKDAEDVDESKETEEPKAAEAVEEEARMAAEAEAARVRAEEEARMAAEAEAARVRAEEEARMAAEAEAARCAEEEARMGAAEAARARRRRQGWRRRPRLRA